MTDKELEKKAEEYAKEQEEYCILGVYDDTAELEYDRGYNIGYINGLEEGFIAGAKEMQEKLISCNEKIDDLRRVNKKLKTKLENTERKIWEISQKCYEVEDIESIISDLNNLSMELEE